MADYAQRIADLLAKAEGTKVDAEAETYREKAYELMSKYAVDQAMIDAKRVREGGISTESIVKENVSFSGIFKDALIHFSHNVVMAFRTMNGYVEKNVVRIEGTKGVKVHIYTIVGYESDVAQAKMLIMSLQVQAASALAEWWKELDLYTGAGVIKETGSPMEKFKTRREFILSFGAGAASRVRDRMRIVMNESGPGTEVALVDRGDQVKRWLKENMNLSRGRGGNLQRGSAEASASGFSAGRRANTGEATINTGQRSIGS
jgi:hypothetical protein